MISDYVHRPIRKCHVSGIPTTVVYLDTETRQEKGEKYEYHRMKLAWTCSIRYSAQGETIAEQWSEWRSPKLMWEYIASLARQKAALHIFTHNAFFDLQVSDFFFYFEKWGWIHTFNYESGLSYILSIKKEKRHIKILSSTNFFQTKLSKLGEMLGLPKGEVDFNKASIEELSPYCRRDVEIVKAAMESYFKFLLDNKLGKFSMTQASQAFRSFRHAFMNDKIYIHDSEEVKELERKAYFGGRVEAFKWREQKQGPFVTVDVNSMYPYMMKNKESPVQLIQELPSCSLKRMKDILKNFCVVAECDIDTGTPIYPIRKDTKLIFPIGKYTTSLCTEGVKTAMKRGHLKKIGNVAVYKKAFIFDDYVDFFFGWKQKYTKEGNKILTYNAKIFLNALYGKFGQKKILTEELERPTNGKYHKEKVFDLEKGIWVDVYYIMNKVIVKYGEKDAPLSFCAIAAHITESSRIYLWELIEKVGLDKVIYCDTDSIKLRKADLKPLLPYLNQYELGKLKVDETVKHLDIMGAKNYKTEKGRTSKGVPQNAEQIGEFRYKYTSFLGQATHLNNDQDRWFMTREVIKDITPKYDKGIIQDDGVIVSFQL